LKKKKPLASKLLLDLEVVFVFTADLGLGLGSEVLLASDATFGFVVFTFDVVSAFAFDFAFAFVSAFAAGFVEFFGLTVFRFAALSIFAIFAFVLAVLDFPVFDPSFFAVAFKSDYGFDAFDVDFFEGFFDVLRLS
jgi:hypothetical protein